MQKMIRKKMADTETATLLETYISGVFGDPAGFEERLYRSEEGFLFLYGFGGEKSPYPQETIKSISAAGAEKWKIQRSR